jgi:hypothetical protein
VPTASSDAATATIETAAVRTVRWVMGMGLLSAGSWD